MEEKMERETIRIKKSTKKQLEQEARKLGLNESEYMRRKLESPLKPRALQKRELCIEKVQRIEMKNQVRDYMKKNECDNALIRLLQNVLEH